jgi:hypothetical protein
MATPSKGRAAVKFAFWTVVAGVLITIVARSYATGQMAAWYYYRSSLDGFAVNANALADATKESPAVLKVGAFGRINGLVAVPVAKGDRLPANATGVISSDVLKAGRRAYLRGDEVVVTVPWEIKESKGFKFKDTFSHKGVRTYPWSAVWNVVMVLGIGLSLGLMAEGFTDLIGIRLEKIRHFEGH